MPGIVAGIDGSQHSHFALEWAMRYAALRHLPLTVITDTDLDSLELTGSNP